MNTTWRSNNEIQRSRFYSIFRNRDVIESSDNAENNIYDIVDFMIGIMTKEQLGQVEDMRGIHKSVSSRLMKKITLTMTLELFLWYTLFQDGSIKCRSKSKKQ